MIAICPCCRVAMEAGRSGTGDRLFACVRCLSGYVVPSALPDSDVQRATWIQEKRFQEKRWTRPTSAKRDYSRSARGEAVIGR